jgi:hypothetical protein
MEPPTRHTQHVCGECWSLGPRRSRFSSWTPRSSRNRRPALRARRETIRGSATTLISPTLNHADQGPPKTQSSSSESEVPVVGLGGRGLRVSRRCWATLTLARISVGASYACFSGTHHDSPHCSLCEPERRSNDPWGNPFGGWHRGRLSQGSVGLLHGTTTKVRRIESEQGTRRMRLSGWNHPGTKAWKGQRGNYFHAVF